MTRGKAWWGSSQEKRWVLLSEIASREHGSLSHWQSGNSLVAWWPFCIALRGWQVLWNDEDAWLATHTHRKRETKQACCSDNKSSEIVTERQSHTHTHTHVCSSSWVRVQLCDVLVYPGQLHLLFCLGFSHLLVPLRLTLMWHATH